MWRRTAIPRSRAGLNYTVTGLTPGQTYTLSFYQAASQQTGFANGLNTTEQWIVSLGTDGMSFCDGCGAADAYYGGHDSTYSNADAGADVEVSPLMTTPSGGTTPWLISFTVNLKADAATDLLSFLAWGDNGSTDQSSADGVPRRRQYPESSVPEPATLSLSRRRPSRPRRDHAASARQARRRGLIT